MASKAKGTWDDTIDKCLPAIVELRVDYVRTFDDQRALCSVGTGFVVDKKNGIILTNRHIVTLGPITGNAVFTNKKRVSIVPIYRDPIHDFGFFKYDPAEIDYKVSLVHSITKLIALMLDCRNCRKSSLPRRRLR